MNPLQQYRRTSSQGWSRIDMLIHIYNHAIDALHRGADLINSGATASEVLEARIDAQRKILLITDGLAIDQGDVPVRIMQLCVFILDQIRSDSTDTWRSAARLLATVRQGFLEVQDACRVAEQNGEVPSLDPAAEVAVSQSA